MVKRYFCNDSDGECCGMLYEHPNGVCVGFLDYKKLEAERDALKELNGELIEALDNILNFKAIDPDGYVGAVRDVARAARGESDDTD